MELGEVERKDETVGGVVIITVATGHEVKGVARGGIERPAEIRVGGAVEVARFTVDIAGRDAIEGGNAVLGKGDEVADGEGFDGGEGGGGVGVEERTVAFDTKTSIDSRGGDGFGVNDREGGAVRGGFSVGIHIYNIFGGKSRESFGKRGIFRFDRDKSGKFFAKNQG